MYTLAKSIDGYEISKEHDLDGPFIKAKSSNNKRNYAVYKHYFLASEQGEFTKVRIDHETIDDVFQSIKSRGVSKGLYISTQNTEYQKKGPISKIHKDETRVESIRHHSTNQEVSYTSTGEKLDSHWPIFKKLDETGFGSIIRATMTLHQVCLSKCSFCSTINRERKDAISLSEAKEFINSLYHQQASFNEEKFPLYNNLYRKQMGSDIRLRGLILSGGGQPNLWPHFSRFVEWLGDLDIDLGLITNGFPKHVNEKIYNNFKWIRLSITPEEASPFYVDGKFNLQHMPTSMFKNQGQTLGLSYVYGPWTTDEMLCRLDEAAIKWSAKYVRLLTDCNLPRNLQLEAHKNLADRLHKLGFVTVEGKPTSKIFHQLKYHGNEEEIKELWPEKTCQLQSYNTFWDTTGHEKNGISHCYPCDSVTVLEEDNEINGAERRFNSDKWGTTVNTEVYRLFTEPLTSYFDPNENCKACLFVKNNRRVQQLTKMKETGYKKLSIPKDMDHINFP